MSPEDPAEPAIQDEAGVPPVKRTLPVYLLFGFCCWHAGFLVFSIIPRTPGQDDRGSPPMDSYRLLTGARQVWNMFESRPALHSLDARLEAEDDGGEKITAGCLLPGFRPYPKPEQSRYYVLFHRLLWGSDCVAFRKEYLRKAAQLSAAQRGSGPGGNWSLVIDADFTRTLDLIRRDGRISLRKTATLSPDGSVANSP